MKKQLHQLRRFFARTGAKKLNAATAREAIPASYDDDDDSNRLSGAFVVVLLLHVVALVGVFAFSRMKDPKLPKEAATEKLTLSAPPAVAESTNSTLPVPTVESVQQDAAPSSALEPSRSILAKSTEDSYVVRNGDTLTKIAIAYSVRPNDLKAANNLTSDNIKPGQELVIPDARKSHPKSEAKAASRSVEKSSSAKSPSSPYTVRKNDTLLKIARTNGVRYEDLIKLNNIKDPKKLQEGQTLKLPK